MRAGVLQLSRWGLLDRVVAAGTPAIGSTLFHYADGRNVRVSIRPKAGVEALFAPRRYLLDRLLVNAAQEAGVDVRHETTVTALRRDERGRVRGATGTPACSSAQPGSGWAPCAGRAPSTRSPRSSPEQLPRCSTGWAFQRQQVGARLGRCAGHVRRSWGPGWALVGDAGYFKDPITTHGTTDAMRDAELLAGEILKSQAGGLPEAVALARYQATRERLSSEFFAATEGVARYDWDVDGVQTLLRRVSSAMSDEVDYLQALQDRRIGPGIPASVPADNAPRAS